MSEEFHDQADRVSLTFINRGLASAKLKLSSKVLGSSSCRARSLPASTPARS